MAITLRFQYRMLLVVRGQIVGLHTAKDLSAMHSLTRSAQAIVHGAPSSTELRRIVSCVLLMLGICGHEAHDGPLPSHAQALTRQCPSGCRSTTPGRVRFTHHSHNTPHHGDNSVRRTLNPTRWLPSLLVILYFAQPSRLLVLFAVRLLRHLLDNKIGRPPNLLAHRLLCTRLIHLAG